MKALNKFWVSNIESIAKFLFIGFLIIVGGLLVTILIRQVYHGVDVSEVSVESENNADIQRAIWDLARRQHGVTSMMCAEMRNMTSAIRASGELIGGEAEKTRAEMREEIRALEKRLGALEKVITGPRPYVLEIEPEKVH